MAEEGEQIAEAAKFLGRSAEAGAKLPALALMGAGGGGPGRAVGKADEVADVAESVAQTWQTQDNKTWLNEPKGTAVITHSEGHPHNIDVRDWQGNPVEAGENYFAVLDEAKVAAQERLTAQPEPPPEPDQRSLLPVRPLGQHAGRPKRLSPYWLHCVTTLLTAVRRSRLAFVNRYVKTNTCRTLGTRFLLSRVPLAQM